MFIVLLTYTKPLDVIDALIEEHVRFLDSYYERGTFLMSGRQVPRTGGVIMAQAENRQELLDILALDPFWREGAARYDLIEFAPTKAAAVCRELLE